MNSIVCPFCDKTIYNNNTDLFKECKHYISRNDNYVDWELIFPIYKLRGIVEFYLWDATTINKKLFISFLQKIKFNEIFSDITIENDTDNDLESLSSEIWIEDEDYDFDRPGDSGVYKTLFIGDKRRIRPITTKLKKFTEQLIDFDKKHERQF